MVFKGDNNNRLSHMVSVIFLEVRIDNGDHFAVFFGESIDHALGVGELDGVPGEVFFAVCVFDIQPG